MLKRLLQNHKYTTTFVKFFENICFAKCLIIWIIFYPNTSAVSEKNKTYNIAFQKCLKNRNQLLIKENRLVHFWQTYLRLLIDFRMTFTLKVKEIKH